MGGGALPLWSSGWESMVQGIPVHGATTPVCHNYWALALEPVKCNYWANEPQLLKPAHPATTEACAVQQEKPLQWEVSAPQRESSPCSLQLEKTHVQQQRHSAARYKERRSQSATQEVLDRDNSQSDVEAVKCTARKARIMVWPWLSRKPIYHLAVSGSVSLCASRHSNARHMAVMENWANTWYINCYY